MEPLHCNSSDGQQLHVVMFPWLAHGHISPFIELSKRLAEKPNIKITFVSTPLNIAKIRSSFEGYIKVDLMELPMPSVDGLPAGIESTAHLPTHLMPLFSMAARGLEKPLQNLLQIISPDFVVFDVVLHWTSKVALKLKIPAIAFSTFGTVCMSYCFCPTRTLEKAVDLTRPPPYYPSSKIRYRSFETGSMIGFYIINSSYAYRDEREADLVIDSLKDCSLIAIKSCNELEGKFMDYYRKVIGRPVVPVGPLLPRPYPVKPDTGNKSDCIKWLEKQELSSVVYVSFGTEYFLSKEKIEEIALGLEDSQQPFLWILRFPSYSDQNKRQISTLLPEGFESRICDRGLLLSNWAPQQEILCHPSTGAFVTHCGWSSLLEGMAAGLPLIALPMQLDQGLNARLAVEELQVGVEVERGSDGFVSRHDVCKAVRMIMVEEQGKYVKSKAAETGELFQAKILDNEGCQGSQNQYVDDFVKLLHDLKGDR